MAERQTRQMMKERFAQRIKEQQERGEKGAGSLFKSGVKDLKFFKCTEKQHTIDIIPYFAGKFDPHVPEGEEAYVFEFYTHRDCGVGEGSIMCLAETYGKVCPICQDRRKKIREGIDEKLLNKLRPARNPRSVYNIICYDDAEEEAKGVQVFHTSHFLMEAQLQELAKVPVRAGVKGIDPLIIFMDPTVGKSIVFKREGQMEKTRYSGMRFSDRPAGFTIDQRDLDDAWALDELIVIPTEEEVAEYYWGKGQVPNQDERAEETGSGRSRNRSSRVENDVPDTIADPLLAESTGRRGRRPVETPEPKNEVEKASQDMADNPCPNGHVFGQDVDKFPKDCEPCEQWKPCSRQNARLITEGVASSQIDKAADIPAEAEVSSGRRSRREEAPADPLPAESTGRRRRA